MKSGCKVNPLADSQCRLQNPARPLEWGLCANKPAFLVLVPGNAICLHTAAAAITPANIITATFPSSITPLNLNQTLCSLAQYILQPCYQLSRDCSPIISLHPLSPHTPSSVHPRRIAISPLFRTVKDLSAQLSSAQIQCDVSIFFVGLFWSLSLSYALVRDFAPLFLSLTQVSLSHLATNCYYHYPPRLNLLSTNILSHNTPHTPYFIQ